MRSVPLARKRGSKMPALARTILSTATIGLLLAAPPLAAQEARIQTAVEDLRIGSVDDPDASLTHFRGVAIGSEGEILIPQEVTGRIRVYGSDGVFMRAFGGKGEGPGEFLSMSAMGWIGDTLWVHDYRQSRVSLFSADGSFITSRTVVPGGLEHPYSPGTVASLGADGLVALRISASSRAIADGLVTSVPLVLIDTTGIVRDTVGHIPVVHSTHAVRFTNGMSFSEQHWGDDPIWSSEPDGSGFHRVTRRSAESGDASSYRISRLGPTGNILYEVSYDYEPVRLEDSEVDRFVKKRAAFYFDSDRPIPTFDSPDEARKAIRDGLYVPEFHPPVSAAVSGLDGSLWLRRERTEEDTAVWEVLDPSGARVAMTRLPANARVMQADLTHAWAQVWDELGVPYLVRYTLGADG